MSVFDLLETQIMQNFLFHALLVVIFHVESKNASHLSFGASNPKRRAQSYMHHVVLQQHFGGLPGVQIGCRIACWKCH